MTERKSTDSEAEEKSDGLKVTPEMIKAGLDSWYSHDREFDDAAYIVKRIFEAMRAREVAEHFGSVDPRFQPF